MPISDSEKLLRDGTTNLTATGNGTGVKVGPGPLHGMKAWFSYASVTGTSPTLTLAIQESADNVTFTTVGTFPAFSGVDASPKYSELHIHWTKDYLRYAATVGGTTPVYTSAKIGLTAGEIATT